jgi:hypothetical protein
LVLAILEVEKRVKDTGYKARLAAYPLPKLIDHHDATARRAKKADKKAKPASKPVKPAKKARSKKAQSKAKAKAKA